MNNEESMENVEIQNDNEDAVNPCPPEWLDSEDNALLRGDAIGDTVYTHRWILKCLLTFAQGLQKYVSISKENETQDCETNDSSKGTEENKSEDFILELDSNVEDAACQLWDMTVEKDVSIHLLNLEEVDILELASIVFDDSRAPRLTEVMVGVVANLCCISEGCDRLLSKDKDGTLVSAVRLLGETSDVPTLCEVLRLISLLLYHRTHRTPSSSWAACPLLKLLCQDVQRNAITFLIINSLTDSLISNVLDLLSSFLFICLPETGINVASLYSTKEIIGGLIDLFERKASYMHKHSDEGQEKLLHSIVLCLYAFIDTPGVKVIQERASVSQLETMLASYLEFEGGVTVASALSSDACDHFTRAIALMQVLIPTGRGSAALTTAGRLIALLQGGQKSEYLAVDATTDSTNAKPTSNARSVTRRDERFSNPSIDECGWVSPPPVAAAPPPSSSPSRSPEEKNLSPPATGDAATDESLTDLRQELENYSYHLLAYWWPSKDTLTDSSVSSVVGGVSAVRQSVVSCLDQCHAHEVLLVLQAARRRDPALVPRMQEHIIDSGKHTRLVALLAQMYQ